MTLETTFDRLGLPKHSARVYETLESRGELSASSLGRATKIHRPALYKALQALEKAGFVAKKGTTVRPLYRAAARSHISTAFAKTAVEVVHLAPATEASVQFYEGKEGITSIFNDVVTHTKKGETFYRYTSEKDLDEVNQYLSPHYRALRDAKKLERLVISNKESGSRKRPRLERFIKYLGSDSEPFSHNAIQLIYDDRLAFIDLNTKRGLIIENATLAEFQKSIFRAFYKKL